MYSPGFPQFKEKPGYVVQGERVNLIDQTLTIVKHRVLPSELEFIHV